MFKLGLVVIPFTAGVASAQPDREEPPRPPEPTVVENHERGFLAGGVDVGVMSSFFHGALVAEGGLKLGDAPLWLHATGRYGGAMDFEGKGGFRRLAGGIEARSCRRHGACLFVDLDAGYEWQTWDSIDDDLEHHHGPLVGPTVGIDTGGETVRFRLAVAVPYYRHTAEIPGLETTTEWRFAPSLAATVAYRL